MSMSEELAFSLMVTDMLEHILAEAGNFGDSLHLLSERFRQLFGVRTVFIYNVIANPEASRTELLAVNPLRRQQLAHDERLKTVAAELSGGADALYFNVDGTARSSRNQVVENAASFITLFSELEIRSCIVIPLECSEHEHVVMLLADCLSERNPDTLLSTLYKLSGVIRLLLRNAIMYRNLENLVKLRTSELERERQQLLQSLAERDVLLKEVHHRVKNSLQIIYSLLYLQGERSAAGEIKEALRSGRGRVAALAQAYSEVYRAGKFTVVDLGAYIKRLVISIFSELNTVPAVTFNLADFPVNLDTAIPIGLIVNEIISNALSFGKGEAISVSLAEDQGTGASGCLLTIQDEGPGLPSDFEKQKQQSLGCSIVLNLAGQLGAQAFWENSNGTRFSLNFSCKGKGSV